MTESGTPAGPVAGGAKDFSCSLTAVLIARVRREAGDAAVPELLREAGSARSPEYLEDIGNWASYDEVIELWKAGARITGDPDFARHAGEDTVRQLGSSSTATVLRSLGSPEALVEQLSVATSRFSGVAVLEATELEPGLARVRAAARPGYRRDKLHCEWTTGMLTQVSVLFGMPPALVEHEACQAEGDPDCRYRITWQAGSEHEAELDEQLASLRKQLEAMSERLENVFATAAALIDSGDLDETLAKITDRAALQVRAPRYLLAVRPAPGGELHCHHKGLEEDEAPRVAELVLGEGDGEFPENWLVAEVSSHRNHYGALVAVFDEGTTFFPQERQLLEVYARYAATAMDSAAALSQARAGQQAAQRRYEESHALLELARQLATAGSSEQIARRLVDAIPAVIDCDRVSVYLWNEQSAEFERRAVNAVGGSSEKAGALSVRPEEVPRLAQWLEQPDPEPIVIDMEESPVAPILRDLGAVAGVAVPIATDDRLLGALVVSVRSRPERLDLGRELRDRLSGVAAQAVTALENGRLVDHITHQASHDQLTGLENRMGFGEKLAAASERAAQAKSPLALLYIDLDGFKAVNDEFGHDVGDELLQVVARRLLDRIRPSDTVARLGGDEFAVLVEGIDDRRQLAAIAERLERAFDEPLAVCGRNFGLRASVGCAVWPDDVSDHRELLRHADAAMYEVKRARQAKAASTPVQIRSESALRV